MDHPAAPMTAKFMRSSPILSVADVLQPVDDLPVQRLCMPTTNQVADLDPDEVAAAQLAIHGRVKQRAVAMRWC